MANARASATDLVVVGDGLVGRSTALALKRALPSARVAIVGAPVDPAAMAECAPCLTPATRSLLARIGIDEDRLVAIGAATHKLAERFERWGRAADWAFAYDRPEPSAGAAHHQLWLQMMDGAPYAQAGPAAGLAAANRYPIGPVAGLDHALRLEPAGFARILADAAARAGVARIGVERFAAERDATGGIAALLVDGRRITADLYLDCTGPHALLRAPDARFEAWDARIGIDTVLIADGPGAPDLADRYRATDHGWQAEVAYRARKSSLFAYARTQVAPGRARKAFGHGADATLIALRPGRVARAWQGNVVAIGEAAASPGPMFATALAMAYADLALFLDLLPGLPIDPGERDEYDRRWAARADRLADFLALPLRGARSVRGPFWTALADRPMPSSLARVLAEFERRGLVGRADEDMFAREDWIGMLMGLGIVPAVRDPIASSRDGAATAQAFAARGGGFAAMLERAVPYPDYLRRLGS